MRSTSLAATATLAAVLLATLTGCITDDPDLVPHPQPTTTPVFATDEEALAAAEEAYRAYLAVSDQILIDGGADPERLLEVATQEVYEIELEGFLDNQERQLRSVGYTVLENVTLQSFDPGSQVSSVVVYACLNVSGVDVLDATDQSIVTHGRPDRTPFVATFDLEDGGSDRLVISAHDFWDGENFCE